MPRNGLNECFHCGAPTWAAPGIEHPLCRICVTDEVRTGVCWGQGWGRSRCDNLIVDEELGFCEKHSKEARKLLARTALQRAA